MTNTKGVIVNIKGTDTKIEYSIGNLHIMGLWDKPFKALRNRTKRIEVRTNTKQIPFDFNYVKSDDKIRFVNEMSGDTFLVRVVIVKVYKSARSFLEAEGLTHSSSKPKSIEDGIKAIESHTGYKEGIKKHGLFAIEVDKIEN